MTHHAENSWVIVDKLTGVAICEIYGTIPPLKNPERYNAMRPSEYLPTLNKKQGQQNA